MPRQPDRSDFVCSGPDCGNLIPRGRALVHGQRYCCDACRNRGWRDDRDWRRRHMRHCARCLAPIFPDLDGKRSDVVYCSGACASAARRARKKRLDADRAKIVVDVAERTGRPVAEIEAVFARNRADGP
jgi:hypothetical protein